MKSRKLILNFLKYFFIFFYFPSIISGIIYFFLLKNSTYEILVILIILVFWLLGLVFFFLVNKRKRIFKLDFDKSTDEGNLFSIEIKRLEKEVENLKTFIRKNSNIFFSIIHEIKNPLTVIGGYASAIIQFDSNFNEEKKKEFIKRISLESDRLNKIIRDYLSNLKEVDDLENMELHKVNIKSILEYFYNIYEIKVKEDRINFILNMEDHLPYVLANTEKIELVISNLVSNALKFALARGFIEIEAKTDNGYVLVSVSNSYDRSKETDVNVIFNGFGKNEKLKVKYEGIGFRLFITKTIVDKLNGKVGIKKDDKNGVLTLYFTLPLYKINKKVNKKGNNGSRKNSGDKKFSYF